MHWTAKHPQAPAFADLRDSFAAMTDDAINAELFVAIRAENQAAAKKVAALAELARRNQPQRDGCPQTAKYVVIRTKCSKATARRVADLADKADDIPETLNAFARGDVSLEVGALSASVINDDTRENAKTGEADRIRSLGMKHYERACYLARKQRAQLTPSEAQLPTVEQQHRDRGIRVVRHRDGMGTAMVTLDPESLNRFENLLADKEAELARTDRQNRDTDQAAGVDRRTSKQRKIDALLSILNAGANATASQPVADITVVLRENSHGTLESSFTDGSFVHQSTVERLCCSSRILRIVLDAEDREISLGTTSRIPTKAQRRALLARDGGCRFGQCAAPRHELHAHHIHHVEHGGHTSLENMVLLCEQHHRLVHEGGFALARLPDGQLELRRPDNSLHSRQPYCAFADEALPLTG